MLQAFGVDVIGIGVDIKGIPLTLAHKSFGVSSATPNCSKARFAARAICKQVHTLGLSMDIKPLLSRSTTGEFNSPPHFFTDDFMTQPLSPC